MSRYFENPYAGIVQGSEQTAVTDIDTRVKQLITTTTTVYRNMPPVPEHCDGGLYVGNAGVAYMFYHLSKNKHLSVHRSEFLGKAVEYLKLSIQYTESRRSRDPSTSFLLGKAGVYALACAICKEVGDIKKSDELALKFSAISTECKTPGDFLGCGSEELFVGRSGYLCGELFLRKELERQVTEDDEIKAIVKEILKSGRLNCQRRAQPSNISLLYTYYDQEYLGAAHGLSSILQMLMCFPQCLDFEDVNDIRSALEFMLSIDVGKFPATFDEVVRREQDQLLHWCHGPPGVVYMFARAYLLWKDQRYLDACVRCAEVTWTKGLLRKGPGICHGVAGNGYVFLLMYRLTGEHKYLERADKFANFMSTEEFISGARRPDCEFSLFEGFAGTACFLGDLLLPDSAVFPFFDIF